MTPEAGDVGLGSAAEGIACSASRRITASKPRRVLQHRGNSGTFGSRPDSFAVLYRTAQPNNAVQARSSSAEWFDD